jgi:hypothetical protein
MNDNRLPTWVTASDDDSDEDMVDDEPLSDQELLDYLGPRLPAETLEWVLAQRAAERIDTARMMEDAPRE